MATTRSLKSVREAAGISQKELAAKLGSSHQLISKWEVGNGKPSQEQKVALCRILGIDEGEIEFIDPSNLQEMVVHILKQNGVTEADLCLVIDNPASHKPFAQAVLAICEKLRTL
jgi:transcriptional regulator with XRE-family HTH domain